MATANLCLHKGARQVSHDELAKIEAPPPAGRWYPIKHARVLETAVGTLEASGYRVRKTQLALSQDGGRFFGTLDLSTELAAGVCLAVGLRNSIDKTFPLGFCAGNRVFVCDNLAFKSELLVRKKHTRFGEERFNAEIGKAVSGLRSFTAVEGARIQRLQAAVLSEEQAEAFMLRAYMQDLLNSRQLPRVVHEWRAPSFEEFRPRTAWSLLNCFTTILGEVAKKNPNDYSLKTMRLQHLLNPTPGGSDGGSTPEGTASPQTNGGAATEAPSTPAPETAGTA